MRFLSHLVNSLGYEVRRKTASVSPRGPYGLGYDLETEAWEAMLRVSSHTMVGYARLVTLYQHAVYCEQMGIPGSFVECGTWRGGAVGLMALANLRHGKVRRALHLFDSFEGVPEPDEKVDGSRAVGAVRAAGGGTSGRLVPVAMSAAPLGDCRTLLEDEIGYPAADLHYHVGWFQETLPHAAGDVGEIAILRLDADWHASTLVCLEHLFPRVVAGGFIVIDDYGEYEGCRNAVDAYLRDAGIRPYLHHVDSTGRYFIKA